MAVEPRRETGRFPGFCGSCRAIPPRGRPTRKGTPRSRADCYTAGGLGSLASVDPVGRFEPAAVVETGVFGGISVARARTGDDVGRIAWLRRLDAQSPWDAQLVSAVEASVTRVREVHNPALLGIIDVARRDDALLVATEYVEGVLLETVMARAVKRRRAVPVQAAVHVARALAEALAKAEEALDAAGAPQTLTAIHTEWVLLGTGDDVLLADLGLVAAAPVLDDPLALAYRAPEQLEGDAGSGASAVYSVGLVLWELLAGREAFDQRQRGTSAAVVRQRALSAALPRPDQVLPRDVPPLVTELTMQCLARDPRARFSGARELSVALQAVAGRPRNEIARLVDELCSDLVAAQRKTFYAPSIAPGSERAERPTLHELSLRDLPKPRRPIGLAAFTPPPGVDSGHAVDALLDESGPASAQPAAALPPPAAAELAPPSSAPPSSAWPEPGVAVATPAAERPRADSLDIPPPRRRWGLIAVVVLACSAAIGLAVAAAFTVMEKPVAVDVAPAQHASAPRLAAPTVSVAASAAPVAPSASAGAGAPVRVAGPVHATRPHDEPGSSVKRWDPWDHSADAGAHAAAPAASSAPPAASAAPAASGAPAAPAASSAPLADPGF